MKAEFLFAFFFFKFLGRRAYSYVGFFQWYGFMASVKTVNQVLVWNAIS